MALTPEEAKKIQTAFGTPVLAKVDTSTVPIVDAQKPLDANELRSQWAQLPYEARDDMMRRAMKNGDTYILGSYPEDERGWQKFSGLKLDDSFIKNTPKFQNTTLSQGRVIDRSAVENQLKNETDPLKRAELKTTLDMSPKEVDPYEKIRKAEDAIKTNERLAQMKANEYANGVDYLVRMRANAASDGPTNVFNEFYKGFARATQQAGGAVFGALEMLSENDPYMTWLNDYAQTQADNARSQILKTPELNRSSSTKNFTEGGFSDPNYYANIMGSLLPHIAGALTASVAGGLVGGGAGAVAGASAYSYSMESGSLYNDLLGQGYSMEEARSAAAKYGVVAAALDSVIPAKVGGAVANTFTQGLLRQGVKQSVKQTFGKMVKEFGKDVFIEASTEAAQELAQNITQSYFDKNQDIWQNVIDSFVGGALGGGVFGAVGAGNQAVQNKSETVPEEMRNYNAENGYQGKEAQQAASQKVTPDVASRLSSIVQSNSVNESVKQGFAKLSEVEEGISASIRLAEVMKAKDPTDTVVQNIQEKAQQELDKIHVQKQMLAKQYENGTKVDVVSMPEFTMSVGETIDGKFISHADLTLETGSEMLTNPTKYDTRAEAEIGMTQLVQEYIGEKLSTDSLSASDIENISKVNTELLSFVSQPNPQRMIRENRDVMLLAQDMKDYGKFEKAVRKNNLLPEGTDLAKFYERARSSEANYITAREARSVVEKYAKDIGVSTEFVQQLTTPQGKRALGSFMRDERVIKLVTRGQEGMPDVEITTPYHEVGHAYFQTMMTPSERAEVLQEIKNNSKKELSDKQAEEILVEDLRAYNDKKTLKALKKRIQPAYARLLDSIKEIVDKVLKWIGRSSEDKINQFYEDVLSMKRPSEKVELEKAEELELFRTADESYLKEKALEYDTYEAFEEAMFSMVPEYAMSHRPSWEGMPPSYDLLQGDALPRDVYDKPEWSIASGRNINKDASVIESLKALMMVRNNPEMEVTIFRASPKNELNIGDWVTFSSTYAKQEGVAENSPVFSHRVKAKDIIFAGDDINEFGYFPRSILEKAYNEAHEVQNIKDFEKTVEENTDVSFRESLSPLEEEALKYDTVEEFKSVINSKKYGGGQEHTVSIDSVTPTSEEFTLSPMGSMTKGAVSVHYVDGQMKITDGNHRYYEALKRGDKSIKIKLDSGFDKSITDIYNKAHGESFRENDTEDTAWTITEKEEVKRYRSAEEFADFKINEKYPLIKSRNDINRGMESQTIANNQNTKNQIKVEQNVIKKLSEEGVIKTVKIGGGKLSPVSDKDWNIVYRNTPNIEKIPVSKMDYNKIQSEYSNFVKEYNKATRTVDPLIDETAWTIPEKEEVKKSVDDALYEVSAQVDVAQAGMRIGVEDGTVAFNSTFPQWVSPDNRSKELLTRASEYLDGRFRIPPKNSPRLRSAVLDLYTEVARLSDGAINIQDIEDSFDKEAVKPIKKRLNYAVFATPITAEDLQMVQDISDNVAKYSEVYSVGEANDAITFLKEAYQRERELLSRTGSPFPVEVSQQLQSVEEYALAGIEDAITAETRVLARNTPNIDVALLIPSDILRNSQNVDEMVAQAREYNPDLGAKLYEMDRTELERLYTSMQNIVTSRPINRLETVSDRLEKNVQTEKGRNDAIVSRLTDARIKMIQMREARAYKQTERNRVRNVARMINLVDRKRIKDLENEVTMSDKQYMKDIYKAQAKGANAASLETARIIKQKLRETRKHKELLGKIESLRSRVKASVKTGGRYYVDFVRKLLEVFDEYDTSSLSNRSMEKLQNVYEMMYNNEQISDEMKEWYKNNIDRVSKKSLREMSYDELVELYSTLSALANKGAFELAQVQYFSEEEKQRRIMLAIDSTKNMDGEGRTGTTRDALSKGAVKEALIRTGLDVLTPVAVMDKFDGSKNFKGWNAMQVRSLQQGEQKWYKQLHMATEELKIRIQEIKPTFTAKEETFLSLVARSREEADGAVNNLLLQLGVTDGVIPAQIEGLTLDQAEQIIDIIEEISDKYEITTQLKTIFEARTNKPFPTKKHYIAPLKYTNRITDTTDADLEALQNFADYGTEVGEGMAISRMEKVNLEVRTDLLTLVTEGWNHSLYYINMQPRVDNIQSVVGSKEFKEHAGRIVSTYWKEYLSQVANKGKSMGQGTFDVILRNLRQNFQVAILGFKVSTILTQPTAGFNAAMTAYAMHGTDFALSIMGELAQAYIVPSYTQEALSQSEALTIRAGSAGSTDFAEINKLMETGLADLRGNYNKLKAGAVKAGMYMIQEVDVRTATAVWNGMYNKFIEKGMSEEKARAEADFFMSLSQSSTQLVDRPLILSRYGEFGRLFFTFQTFSLGLWSMITQGLVVNGIMKGTPKVKIKSALALLAIPFFTAFAGEMISIVNNAIKGKDDDEDIEDKLKNALENTWVELVATVPLFGSIIKGKVLYNRSYEVPLVGTGIELIGGIEGLMSAQDYDNFMNNLMTLGKTSSIFAGIPGAFQATDVINRFIITEKEKKQIETRAIARAYMDAKEMNLDKYVTDLIMKLYTKEEIKNLKSTTKTTLKTNILKEVVRLGKNEEAKNVLKLSKNEEKADYLKEIRDQYTPAEFKQLVNYLKKYKVLSDDAELLIYKK